MLIMPLTGHYHTLIATRGNTIAEGISKGCRFVKIEIDIWLQWGTASRKTMEVHELI
jgi:hypothetical protein